MHGERQILDSYQNLVCCAVDDGSDAVIPADPRGGAEPAADDDYPASAAVYALDGLWDSDEEAERFAGDLSSDRAEGDRKRRAPAGHGSGDRNETAYEHGAGTSGPGEDGRGRGSSGESYEDEADESLF